MNDTVIATHAVPARNWIAIAALGLSAFTIVTSELAPVGMLNALANDLHQPAATTGLIVTAYGWVAALAALCSGMLPARTPRKALLVGLMVILAGSCLMAMRAYALPALMTARITGALAHGVFWALIGTVAARLVPASRLGLATSVIFGGVSAASVLGVPLASFMAAAAGWRSAFGAIALLALAAAVVLWRTLPALTPPAPLKLNDYLAIFRHRTLLTLFGATAAVITAHFAAFTYIDPLLTLKQGIAPAAVSAMLLMAGIAGVAGNMIAGKLIDRHPRGLILSALLLSALALGALSIAALPHGLTALLLALWSAGIAVIFVGLQTWLLRSAGTAAQPASALYVAIFNAAIGSGALAGGHLAGLIGLQKMVLMAAAVMLVSSLFILRLRTPR